MKTLLIKILSWLTGKSKIDNLLYESLSLRYNLETTHSEITDGVEVRIVFFGGCSFGGRVDVVKNDSVLVSKNFAHVGHLNRCLSRVSGVIYEAGIENLSK